MNQVPSTNPFPVYNKGLSDEVLHDAERPALSGPARLTLLKTMDMRKRSSSSVSDRWGQSKVKKRTVKSTVAYW